MTKAEIIKKTNSYKEEYNIQNFYVGKYKQTLNFLNRYKQFFSVRDKKTKSLKNTLLISGIISSLIAGLIMLSSSILSIPFIIVSLIILDRFFFFKMVNKKFNRCANFFEKLSNRVNEKELARLNQKQHIMAQIIALENEIPDDIKETIMLMEEELNDENNIIQSETLTI